MDSPPDLPRCTCGSKDKAPDYDGHAKFNVVVRGVSLASAFFGLAIKIIELIEKVRPFFGG